MWCTCRPDPNRGGNHRTSGCPDPGVGFRGWGSGWLRYIGGRSALSDRNLIAVCEATVLTDYHHLPVAHGMLDQACQFLRAGVGVLQGDVPAHFVVVQIHCFGVRKVVRPAFVGRGEVTGPALVEPLGEQGIPVRVTEGIRVPVHDSRATEGRLGCVLGSDLDIAGVLDSGPPEIVEHAGFTAGHVHRLHADLPGQPPTHPGRIRDHAIRIDGDLIGAENFPRRAADAGKRIRRCGAQRIPVPATGQAIEYGQHRHPSPQRRCWSAHPPRPLPDRTTPGATTRPQCGPSPHRRAAGPHRHGRRRARPIPARPDHRKTHPIRPAPAGCERAHYRCPPPPRAGSAAQHDRRVPRHSARSRQAPSG